MNNFSISLRELRDIRFRGDIFRAMYAKLRYYRYDAKIKNSKRNAKRLNNFHGKGA